MPVTRYQLRNEYGLADSDLYRAADKDDSEALLEAVAMAGLVGVLRQLGDLAEFAAEIFHDLHEEVVATAARGHTLAVRAHQLETEVPAIEKTFLSQKKNPSFYTNTGIDWHPILHTDENLITRGDLPRCVMDSFEECFGPPRLFLLDKFDVAGAGTCLKRYTDPSFFKNVTDTSKLKALYVQREKKMRKTKKKGPSLKNGETHQNFPTSHAKSGKTYMEKFLQTPSPEHKVVYETSVDPPPLKLTLDNSSQSGNETVDIGIVSPVKRSWEIKESICSSPNSLEMALKPNKEELDSEISALETAKAHVLASAVDTGRIPSIPARVTDMDIQGSSPAGLVYANDAIIDLGQASGSSCLSNRNIKPLLDELHGDEEPISPDAMTHLSRSPELDTEYEIRCTYLDQVRQTGSTEENAEENPAPLATISMKSTIMPLEEQLSSKLPETGHSDEKLLPDMLEVMRPANSSSEVSINLANTNPLVEILQCQGTNEQQSDRVHSDIGAHSDNYLLPCMFEVSDDVAASTACGTIFHDDNDNHGSVPSVLIVSPSRSPMISEEHHPGSEIPYEQEHKFTKIIYPEHLIYSEAETDQGKVSTEDSDSVVSKPGSCNNSQREDVTQNSTLTEKVDTAMLGNSDNIAAPPNLNSETHPEQLLELLSNQIHGESPRGDDACPNSSKLISGRLQPHIGQEVCFALDEPSLGDLPGQHPIPSAGVFAQSVDQEIDQVKHTIASFLSGFGLVHGATNLGMVEMPPLPPVQWRMGNAQLDSRDSQSELVRNAEESFALTSEYGVDRKGRLDFSAPMLQGVESRSMYPLSEDVEVKQHPFSDKSADSLAQPTGFVVDMSSMADDTSIRHSSTSFENMQSSPSFVIEAMSRKRQEYGSPIEENGREGFRRPFAQETGLEKTISGHDAMSLLENQAVPSDPHIVDSATEGIVQAILPECGARVEDSVGMPITQTANGQEQPSNNQENQAAVNLKGKPQVNDEVQHPTGAVEHPLHDLAKFGGEMQPTCIPPIKHCLPISEAAPLSHSKAPLFGAIRKVNGNPAIKNPRPEDPLIDVFAALDKSRLRKVSKQVRPQVGSKVDERDSLLEQIRTKSFNLRPAGGTRPIIQRIQGPITNLRVAAILEKANTIRQATAGSDEEGDDDSWSDS